jgi:hypothetical protein
MFIFLVLLALKVFCSHVDHSTCLLVWFLYTLSSPTLLQVTICCPVAYT